MISQSAYTDGRGASSAPISTLQEQRASPGLTSCTRAKENLADTREPDRTGAVKRTLSKP